METAAGSVLQYSTGACGERRLEDGSTFDVLETVILTRDSAGVVVRRLREEYAPALLTAVWGAFEEPDGADGWRTTREFTLVEVRPPQP